MRRYETIAIIDPDLSDEERAEVLKRTTDLIPKEGGFLVMLDEWGNRRLAYEIKKKARGYYARIDYCGMGSLVDEMERLFRIDDKVLKFMTVLLDKNADVESIKEEMAIAKSEAEAKSKAKAEAARKKAEEAEKEAGVTDEVAGENDETDSDNSNLDPAGTETVEAEESETETTETEINKEEQ